MDELDGTRINVPGLEIRVVDRCTSTNAVLSVEKTGSQVLLAAEEQTAGRGLSPPFHRHRPETGGRPRRRADSISRRRGRR